MVGDHNDRTMRGSPGKVTSSEKSSNSRTEPWTVPSFEGCQRERILQRDRREKETRGKARTERYPSHQGRRSRKDRWVVSGVNMNGR